MMRRWIRPVSIVFVGLGLCLAAVTPSSALPAFARKYGFECTMCHSNFPRLNDFGWRYRQNGYQLPGRENQERTVLEASAPFAARTGAGYVVDKISHEQDATADSMEVNRFQVNGIDLFSGGLLGHNIGYLFVYLPKIEGVPAFEEQEGSLEMANVMFSNLHGTWLNMRVGRFEPAYVTVSSARRLTVAPYAVYDTAVAGLDPVSKSQTGIEVSGYGRLNGVSFAAGWVNGSPTNESDDMPADVYIRGAKVFGAGEGQTAGHRIGASAYFGQARPESSLDGGDRETYFRLGVDGSLNLRQWNFTGQFLRGSYDKRLFGSDDDLNVTGGFFEANFLPSSSAVMFARFDLVDFSESDSGDTNVFTVGGRYYPHPNLALHAEYARQGWKAAEGGDDDPARNGFTLRADWGI